MNDLATAPEMDNDFDDKYAGRSYILEARADWEQADAEERRRCEEEHPGYEQCPKHPDRPVVNSGVSTLRHCAECVEDAKARYADHRPPDAWRGDDQNDMRYYSDHPRYDREQGDLK